MVAGDRLKGPKSKEAYGWGATSVLRTPHLLFLASGSLEEKQLAGEHSRPFLQLGRWQGSVLSSLIPEVGDKIDPPYTACFLSSKHSMATFHELLLKALLAQGIVLGVKDSDMPIQSFPS